MNNRNPYIYNFEDSDFKNSMRISLAAFGRGERFSAIECYRHPCTHASSDEPNTDSRGDHGVDVILNQKACGCKRRYMKSVLGTVSAFRRIFGTRCHFVLNGQKEGLIRVGGCMWSGQLGSCWRIY